jgi:hypothetical protein
MLSGGLNVARATNTGTANEALTSRSKDMYSRLKKEAKAFKLPILVFAYRDNAVREAGESAERVF